MNRKIFASILVALVCLSFGLLTGCSSSSSTPPPPPTIAISATGGSGQSAAEGQPFANPLVATVTSNGAPSSGATVTFAAPASGASCVPSATSVTTGSDGTASITCTANNSAGTYSVTASTSGASSPASFSLTNTGTVVPVTAVFSVSGTEVPNASNGGFIDYYAIAGAIQFDSASGAFIAGEQDYNDGGGITSPTTGDTLDPSSPGFSASVFTTGQGTLTVISDNACACEGVAGTETFAVQLVSATHGLITQFDGSATSFGTLDLQSATAAGTGDYSFTMSGYDIDFYPVGYGGVFTLNADGSIGGTADLNDSGPGVVTLGNSFTGQATASDSFGRGTVSGINIDGQDLSLVYYVVGPEVMRLLDNDTGALSTTANAMLGSAYSHGGASFNNASIGASVLAVQGNSYNPYATLGQFATSNTGTDPASFAGVGDESEPLDGVQAVASPFSGVYSMSNAYGYLNVTDGGLGPNATILGVYMVDPNLNIMDPNNTATDLGGALVLEQDLILAGGTGVLIPQTDTTADDFTGSYAAGFQNFNDYFGSDTCSFGCEWDMVSAGSMSSGTLNLTGMDSDPLGSLNDTGTPAETTGDTFMGTASADAGNAGRWTLPLGITVNTDETGTIDMDIFQASGTLLFWMETDGEGVSLGPLEAANFAPKALHMKGKSVPKAQAKPTIKPKR